MVKLVVLALFVSCNGDYYKITSADLISTQTPYKLKISGPISVVADQCSSAVNIQRFDSANRLTKSSLPSTVILDPKANGSFHLLPDCSDPAVNTVTINAGESSLVVYYKNTLSGVKQVAASGLTVVGLLSINVTSSLPEFSFLKESFTTDETSAAIGTDITIIRSLSGATQAVTVTGQTISNDPSEINLSAQTITFAPGDVSKTVTFPFLSNSGFKGDRFYRIKLSSPTNGAILGEKSESIVNILEDEIAPGKFFFSLPLYTASEEGGSVSIRIERTSSGTETINLTTIDGSATGMTHFGSVPQTVTFTGFQKEAVVTIPIVDNAVAGDSKSFYIELKNPNANSALITRPWSTAKVRIIDNDEAPVCDDTQTSAFGGGTGVLGDPFLICSLAQLNLVAANLDKHFKLTRDLDIGGFVPVPGIFSGVFNGNEKVLKNFRYTGGSSAAFFQEIGGHTDVAITGLNLTQAYLYSSGGHAAGLVAQANNSYSNLSNNFFSGASIARYVSAGIMAVTTTTHSLPDKNNFSHGTIYGPTVAGGIIGNAPNSGSPKIWIDHSYSVSTILSDDRAGGLLGDFIYVSNGGVELTYSHAKGYVSGFENDSTDPDNYISHSGGLAGGIWLSDYSPLDISHNFYEGKVFGSSRTGGLVGEISINGPAAPLYTVHDNRVQAEIRAADRAGGLIGDLFGSHHFTYKNNVSSATIIGDANSNNGGHIGRITFEGTGTPVIDIIDCQFTSLGSITTTFDNSNGGIVGGILLSQTPHLNLKNLVSYGNISAVNAYDVGGIVGQLANYSPGSDESSTQTIIQNVHSYGDMSGKNNTAGLIGYVGIQKAPISSPAFVSIDSSSSSGDILSSQNYAGGLIAGVNQAHNTSFSVTNSFSSGDVSSPQNAAGLIGIAQIESTMANFTISKSSARGDISAGINGYAGGLTGEISCNDTGTILIEKSFASGNVHSDNEDAGGLITGFNLYSGSCSATVANSYSAGTVEAQDWASGLVGYFQGSVTITNSYTVSRLAGIVGTDVDGVAFGYGTHSLSLNSSYFLKDSGFNDTIPGPSPRTSDNLKLQTTFVGWNFSSVWEFGGGPYLYPTLRENPHH